MTVSLPQIATVSGAATAPACKPEIGASLTVICITLLYSSHVAPPYVLIAARLKKVVVLIAVVGVYTCVVADAVTLPKFVP